MEREGAGHPDRDDPDTSTGTCYRHLGGDSGPYDPALVVEDFSGLAISGASGTSGTSGGEEEWEDVEDDNDGDNNNEDDDGADDNDDGVDDFPRYPRNPKDEDDTDGILFLYGTAYFVPQWDEHLIGPSWRTLRAGWDFDDPPKPLPPTDALMKDAFRYCPDCQLTWLVGFDGLESHVHPEHNAYDIAPENLDVYAIDAGSFSNSSLVVHVSGGLPKGLGTAYHAAIGVYFGEGSRYNVSEALGPEDGAPFNKEKAELKAVLRALDVIENKVLPEWQEVMAGDSAALTAKISSQKGWFVQTRDRVERKIGVLLARFRLAGKKDDDDLEKEERDFRDALATAAAAAAAHSEGRVTGARKGKELGHHLAVEKGDIETYEEMDMIVDETSARVENILITRNGPVAPAMDETKRRHVENIEAGIPSLSAIERAGGDENFIMETAELKHCLTILKEYQYGLDPPLVQGVLRAIESLPDDLVKLAATAPPPGGSSSSTQKGSDRGKQAVSKNDDDDDDDANSDSDTTASDSATETFRLIMVSDSSDLVDTICKHQGKWKLGEDGVLRNRHRKPVKNGAEYVELGEATERLSKERCCYASWYAVGKQFNLGAAGLMGDALSGRGGGGAGAGAGGG